MVGPLYQRIGSNQLQAMSVSFSLMLCRAGALDFSGSSRRPHEITFRFPSHPSVDLFKRLPQSTDCGTASLSTNLTIFPLNPGLHKTRLQHFSKAMQNPAFTLQSSFFFFFNGWISTRIVPKNSDRNIKCPSVSARACHPSCCTLVSSDERQPPNMWQGHGPRGKWFGKCSIYSVSQCLAFQTCNLQTRYPFAMLI